MSLASYSFGPVQLLPTERRLIVGGDDISIGARAFDVLLTLIERRDRLVTRDELLDVVWPDAAVEPNNIAVQVNALRKVLGPQTIATVPGRGYRFGASVDELARVEKPVLQQVAQPAAPVGHCRTNLPERLPKLIGRDDDLRLVGELIDAHRIVTIVGAGGIGKTRLAERLLDERRGRYQHGLCWVALASITDPADLPGAIGSALGINLAGGEPTAVLAAALAPLDILLGLDNVEHLVAETGSLVEAIVAVSGRVRIVVTSQAPLHLADEQVVRLGALAVPPHTVSAVEALGYGAVDLFVQRARAADARFVFDDGNAAAVIRLCGRLDGLPLAIEFAAARAPLLGVERVLASLDQRLEVLKGGHRSAPPRQQTIRAALEWSHQLLGQNERVVFRRLGVVAGSASLELVESIAADHDHVTADADGPLDRWAVLDALGVLIDRSLVTIVVDERDPDRPRYRLLESPRAYAVERLAAAGEVALVEERHARAMAVLLAEAWADRWNGRIGFVDWMDRVEADRDNARLAFAWALREQAFDLVMAMAPLLLTRSWQGTTYDARVAVAESVERWLATQPMEPSQLAARIQLMRFWSERQLSHSLTVGRDALSLAEACGDRFAAHFIEAWSVRIHLQLRDLDAAAAALARADALEDPAWPAVRLVTGAEARSAYHFVKGPPGAALEPVRHEIRLARLAGYDGLMASGNLVAVELMVGNYASAAATARKLLDEMKESRNEFARVHVRINLLGALLALGRVEEARPVAEETWRTARASEMHGDCADHLALLCALERRWSAAATLVGYADAVYARRGAQRWPSEMQAHGQTLLLLNDALEQANLERLMRDGGRLPDAAVAQVAFGET